MSDQEPQKINRRGLFKIMAGLAPAGALAWLANKMPVKAEEVVISVDLAEPGAVIPEFSAAGFDERED